MLSTTPPIAGLSHAEAARRRRHTPVWLSRWYSIAGYAIIIWGIVANWLHVIIIGLAVALWSVGLRIDALATSSVVVLNIIVSVVQLARARYQLNRMTIIAMPSVAVWRDNALQRIAPAEVVVGDVVLLAPGDQVIADGILIGADQLALDESLLTGESEPQSRRDGDAIFAGAVCVRGSAWYQIHSFTGVAHQLQQRAQVVRLIRTPLTRQIDTVMRVIMAVVVVLCAMIVVRDWSVTVPIATYISQLTVIAGLIPNALVLMLTLSYAMAALQMARVGGLVQQLAAIEAMHHARVLCFDKTGTITLNQLTVQGMYPVNASESAFQSALAAFVANDVSGNATVQAIARALPGAPTTVHHHVMFDSTRKWSMQVHENGVWVLGAPDVLMPAMIPAHRAMVEMQQFQQSGARVVLFAHAPVISERVDDIAAVLPTELIPYGFVVLVDVLRLHVDRVMAQCQQQGIKVCILSGDHPDAVRALVSQVRDVVGVDVYHGVDVDAADDAQLARMVAHATVYGRLTPAHKERIVAMWRRSGYQVAMIGDGLNDIPAMRAADIAIAMQSGSSAVRLVADVVLLDDDFAIVPHLFQQGKRIVSRMSLVLNHFLLRIITSAGIIGLCIVMQIPLWAPWQSSLLALCGVALPAIYVIGTHMDLRLPVSLMQMLGYAGVVAVLVASIVAMTDILAPAYASWVGVCVSLLVLWGHAVWLGRPGRRDTPTTPCKR